MSEFSSVLELAREVASEANRIKSGRKAEETAERVLNRVGETKVALQIVWKLKQVKAVKNVLFLTDRDWLLTQAMDNEFAPFRDARARIRGELRTAQDIAGIIVLQQKELAPLVDIIAGVKHDAKDNAVGIQSEIKGDTLEQLVKAAAELARKGPGGIK